MLLQLVTPTIGISFPLPEDTDAGGLGDAMLDETLKEHPPHLPLMLDN